MSDKPADETGSSPSRQGRSYTGRSAADAVLVASLAAGSPWRAAAEAAGVSLATLGRRMADAAFRQQVEAARRALLDRAIGTLAGQLTNAVQTLGTLVADATTPPAVRLSAAKSIIELCLKIREHEDLAERLTTLENSIGAGSGKPARLILDPAVVEHLEPTEPNS